MLNQIVVNQINFIQIELDQIIINQINQINPQHPANQRRPVGGRN